MTRYPTQESGVVISAVQSPYPTQKSGAAVSAIQGPYPEQNDTETSVDTTNVTDLRILNFVQRVGLNIGDVSGTLFNTAGNTLTLDGVDFSAVGLSGPWSNAIVLDTDGAYNFPTTPGDDEPFNIPILIPDETPSGVFLRVRISF
jgi:hypothetical protein